MAKNIKLSPKYGVNPSMSICFFCGEPKELLLLGKLPGDVKAPKGVLVDYDPCPKCSEKLQQGVTVIEVTTVDNGRAPIQSGAWPTGRWCVLSKESGAKLFKDTGKRNTVLLEDVLYQQLVDKNK